MSDTIQAIVQGISTVGFPIACCCFLLYQNTKQDAYHRGEQEKLRKTIDNNTRSIDMLVQIVKELKSKMEV